MQHARSQKETSKEVGETNAGKTSCKRTKWTAQMNADLIDSRKEANALYSTQDCPRKERGRKIGIMESTKRLWDTKGYAELKKSSQNLRDQYAKITKALSQPESQFLNNELGNQTMPTTTERGGTIDGDENTATIEQSSNEPSEEYNTLANNAKKWYEVIRRVKEKNWSERTSNTFCKNVLKNKDIKVYKNAYSMYIYSCFFPNLQNRCFNKFKNSY